MFFIVRYISYSTYEIHMIRADIRSRVQSKYPDLVREREEYSQIEYFIFVFHIFDEHASYCTS